MSFLVPIEPTADLKGCYLDEANRRYAILRAAKRDRGLQQYLLERCSADPWFFFSHFIWSRHPRHGPTPFLAYSFQRTLIDEILGRDGWTLPSGQRYTLGVYKSRETGGSVICCGCALWEWLFRDNSTNYFCSLRQEAVDDGRMSFDKTLFGKIRYMIRSLPKWMRPGPWKKSAKPRTHDFTANLINPERNSSLIGISTSADGFRSARANRVFVDEANVIPFLKDLMTAAAKVGPICLISSVKGDDTHFAKFCRGEVSKPAKERGQLGVLIRKLHYSSMPHLDPTTPEGAAAIEEMRTSLGLTEEAWAQEMECDFDAIKPGKIWSKYLPEDAVLDYEQARELLIEAEDQGISILGWDFGDGPSPVSVVVSYYLPRRDLLICTDYKEWRETLADEVAADVKSDLGWFSGRLPTYSVGDPSGKSRAPRQWGGVRMNESEGWIANLKRNMVKVSGQSYNDSRAIDLVAVKLRDGKIKFTSGCMRQRDDRFPSLVDAVRGYHRAFDGDAEDFEGKRGPLPVKDKHSHLADALKHCVWRAFEKISV